MKYLLALILTSSLFAAEVEGEKPGSSEIRVVPMDPTPEPNEIKVYIVLPKADEVTTDSPVPLQLRVQGYPIGTYSEFPRANEIRNDKDGQSLHILIDDRPYIEVNEAYEDTGSQEMSDFNYTINMDIPFKLSPGAHVIRIFPVRSFGESLKGDGCFAACQFYYSREKGNMDLSACYLTYNQPYGTFKSGQPILLDFYLTNCQLSKDGYKVRLTIDGSDKRTLIKWVPYYIYGLSKGTHKIKLELFDPRGKVVPSLFSDSPTIIKVQ